MIYWGHWRYTEGIDGILRELTAYWGGWRHTEGTDDILRALTAYCEHWRHTEGTDDILRALTAYWGHWRHIEGTDDILRALTAYWGHWTLQSIWNRCQLVCLVLVLNIIYTKGHIYSQYILLKSNETIYEFIIHMVLYNKNYKTSHLYILSLRIYSI